MALLQKIKESIISTGSFDLSPTQKRQIKHVFKAQDKKQSDRTAFALANTLFNVGYFDLASIRKSVEIFFSKEAGYLGNVVGFCIKKSENIKSDMHIKNSFEYYISSTNNIRALIFYLLCYAEFEYDKENQFYNQLMFLGKVKELKFFADNIFSKIPDDDLKCRYLISVEREFQVDNDKSALKNILLSLYQKNEEIKYEFEENVLQCDSKTEVRLKTGFVNHHVSLSEVQEDLFQNLKSLFINLMNNNTDNIDAFDELFLRNEIIRPDNYAQRLTKELSDDSNINAIDFSIGINKIYLHCRCLYTLKFLYSVVFYTIHLNAFEKIYEEGKKLAFCPELTEYLSPILARTEDGRRVIYKIILNTYEYGRISAIKYFIPKSTSDFGLLICSAWKNDLEVKSPAYYAFINSKLSEAFLYDRIYCDPLYSRIFPGQLIHIFNAMVHDHDDEYSIKDIKQFWIILEKYSIYEKYLNDYENGKEFLHNLYDYLSNFSEDDIKRIEGYSPEIHNNLLAIVKNEMKN